MYPIISKIRNTTTYLLLWTVTASLPTAASPLPLTSVSAWAGLALAPKAAPQPGQLPADGDTDPAVHIAVISGHNGVNVIRKRTVAPVVVEVKDHNGAPLSGAIVTFTSPSGGASVVFADEMRSATVVTGADGKASVLDAIARNQGGFNYQISALYHDQMATATIHQINVLSAADTTSAQDNSQSNQTTATPGTPTTTTGAAPHKRIRGWVIATLVGGVAVGAGIGLALSNKGPNTGAAAAPVTTIGTGPGVTAGAPH